MQGERLKDIRNGMAKSQAELAQELGLTQTFIGMMERGEKAIEPRTELATQHVFARSLLYGWREEPDERSDDVPLAKAMILWKPDAKAAPPVRIVRHGAEDDRRYSSSGGACMADWQYADDVGRMFLLYRKFHELVMLYGIDPKAVHRAFLVIPEYRAAIPRDLLEDREYA